MDHKKKIGIIGYGAWGKKVFQRIDKSKKFSIEFVETSTAKFPDKYHLVNWIVVLVPTKNHYEVVKKFLNLKKNIICEKPLGGNLSKAKILYNLAKKNKCKLYVNNIESHKLSNKKILHFQKENNLLIENHRNKKNYSFLFFVNEILYHDFYLCSFFFKKESLSVSLQEEKSKFILNLSSKKKNAFLHFSFGRNVLNKHAINNVNLLSTKDYLNSFFEDIVCNNKISNKENKNQTIFALKILNIISIILNK
jgi:hypothetical protein